VKPRLLDLFCGAGGAGAGYSRAGFDIVGVDINPQPHYPFDFIQGDALGALRSFECFEGIDAIHASPPCQAYSTMSNRHGSISPLLIDEVRDLFYATHVPYVIENVVGARRHMHSPLLLHGDMFGLGVYRPRLFESNMLFLAPTARRPTDAAAVYGQRGDSRLLWTRNDGSELRCATLTEAQQAMGMHWADWHGIKEAIPPAYTEHIGQQLLEHLQAAA
jgi:DNA (cytosine-5)-methyltransferase 1